MSATAVAEVLRWVAVASGGWEGEAGRTVSLPWLVPCAWSETKKPFQIFSDSRIRQVSNSPGSAPAAEQDSSSKCPRFVLSSNWEHVDATSRGTPREYPHTNRRKPSKSFRHTNTKHTYVPRAPAGSEPARFLAEWTRRRFLGETSPPISREPDRRSRRPFLRSHLQFPLLSKCPAVSAGHASPRAPSR